MRFWKYLTGSVIRISGVITALIGLGSGAFGITPVIGIPAIMLGVILCLLSRKTHAESSPFRQLRRLEVTSTAVFFTAGAMRK